MKRLLLLLIALLAIFATSARADTDMLTAAGVLVPTNSTCPAAPRGTCSSGWFRVGGHERVFVGAWADAGTNTIILEGRLSSTGNTYTLHTWTDADSTEVPFEVDPVGDVRIRVTAIAGGGTVKAKILSYTQTGTPQW